MRGRSRALDRRTFLSLAGAAFGAAPFHALACRAARILRYSGRLPRGRGLRCRALRWGGGLRARSAPAPRLQALMPPGEARHAASYYIWRTGSGHEHARMSACSDAQTQIVIAAGTGRGSEHDVLHVPALLSKVRRPAPPPEVVVMDKGHGAECVHEAARNIGTRTAMPARQYGPGRGTRGRHGRQLRRGFQPGPAQAACPRRVRAWTAFQAIRGASGPSAVSRGSQMRETELMYRVLACNCHRACVISRVVLVMISREPIIENFPSDGTVQEFVDARPDRVRPEIP